MKLKKEIGKSLEKERRHNNHKTAENNTLTENNRKLETFDICKNERPAVRKRGTSDKSYAASNQHRLRNGRHFDKLGKHYKEGKNSGLSNMEYEKCKSTISATGTDWSLNDKKNDVKSDLITKRRNAWTDSHLYSGGKSTKYGNRIESDSRTYCSGIVNRGYRSLSNTRTRSREENPTFGITLLNDLEKKEPSHIVMTLVNQHVQFRQCLLESASNTALFKAILKVLAKAMTCNSLSEMMMHIYSVAKETRFFDAVALHLVDLETGILDDDRENITQQVKAVLTIIWRLSIMNPSSIDTFSRIHTTLGKLIGSCQTSTSLIEDEILKEYASFSEHKARISTSQQIKPRIQLTSEDKDVPPEDFRDIQVFPQMEDINTDLEPFLRRNKTEGGYVDLNHYLDVQFRLLREDFIGPLRDGIGEYLKARQEGWMHPKLQDVKVYSNVRIGSAKYNKDGVAYTLTFEMTRGLRKIDWKSSKRLIYGSLVCLSADNFNSVYFASVVDRNEYFIKHGMFDVHFEHDQSTIKKILTRQYTMVETTAYFESYRHVLSALQTIRPTELPFEKYIVQCETNCSAPSYLRNEDTYDLRPLTVERFVIRSDKHFRRIDPKSNTETNAAKSVNVLDQHAWPSNSLLRIDKSQFAAIHKAITKEFAIIQGPPGTGKTYIGLKMVKALLYNKHVWSKHPHTGKIDQRPMLIVCYTNHALDQFLEGIVQFFNGDVVRVGGRSKSDALTRFNIKHLRRTFREQKKASKELFKARKQAEEAYGESERKLRTLSGKIEICKCDILHERFLKPYIRKETYKSLTLGPKKTGKQSFKGSHFSWIVKWLGMASLKTKGIQETNENMKCQSTPRTENELIQVHGEAHLMQEERRLDTDDVEEIEKSNHNTIDIESVAYRVIVNDEKPHAMEEEKWKERIDQRRRLKQRLANKISSNDIMTETEAEQIADVWKMRAWDKWRLYRLWIQRLISEIRGDIDLCGDDFDAASRRYKEVAMQEDKEILKQSTVIGMTTTGAARYQSVLQEVCPRIIVVEEAAEVLEGHIIATLSKGCEHLILIGDHKQLKPNPTLYRLAVKFNLNLSLFERMINNGVNYNCLQIQHRMRPEIAELLQDIYENLQNHDDVNKYADVKGIASNIFLINHNKYETEIAESKSHSNEFEADLSVALCRYLLLQGYKRDQITILTTYSGQMFCLRDRMPQHMFDGVKVTVVDNYQGEENDIVILSLVRSNTIGSIGFLKTPNRICVALSRAKIGLYIIGNFDILETKSDLWKSIVSNMKLRNQIGESLSLYCQNHPTDDGISVKCGADFEKAPEGGCSKQCFVRLSCGHVCRMFCHVLDKDHTIYRCQEECLHSCERQHPCPKKCFEECGVCMEMISKIIPLCGHEQLVPCYMDPKDYICQDICETTLSCGHSCTNVCGESHCQCRVNVEKTWPCGHTAYVECYRFERALCQEPCRKVLKCDHLCKKTCGECFNGRLHLQCSVNCKRILVCSHECLGTCNSCPPCRRTCENKCKHSKCDRSCGQLCKPCKEPCAWKCSHFKCRKLCSEPCDRPPCYKPCRQKLQCKHFCIGFCGEPCPPYCRVCDKEKVTTIIFGKEDEKNAKFVLLEDCGHIVEYTALNKYMLMKSIDTDNNSLIKLKGCPICTTPIRTSYRYGNMINTVLRDIEKVKKTILGEYTATEKSKTYVGPRLNVNLRRLEHDQQPISERMKITQQNQLELARDIKRLFEKWVKLKKYTKLPKNEENMFDFLGYMFTWVKKPREYLTDQEVYDFQRETTRNRMYLKLKHIETCIKRSGKIDKAAEDINSTKAILTVHEKFTEEMENKTTVAFEKLRELTSIDGLGIYEDERAMIVKAMSLSAGHWFKCPNNHVYAIGECGGATQEGNCPECKAKIGGQQHRLTAGNALAPEMDGARYAAYSEEANNMGNFQLED